MKDMGSRSFRSAKNFGIVGAIWGGTECCIESVGNPIGILYIDNPANYFDSIVLETILRTVLQLAVSQAAFSGPVAVHKRP